jgi:hypothetical protein
MADNGDDDRVHAYGASVRGPGGGAGAGIGFKGGEQQDEYMRIGGGGSFGQRGSAVSMTSLGSGGYGFDPHMLAPQLGETEFGFDTAPPFEVAGGPQSDSRFGALLDGIDLTANAASDGMMDIMY